MLFKPPILMSRFMLNLRQIPSDTNFQTCSADIPQFRAESSDLGRGGLASIIGNMGEPLTHGEVVEEVE